MTTAFSLIPFDNWADGLTQASVTANDNARRAEVIALPALSFEASQPGSPAEGDLYVLSDDWGLSFVDSAGDPISADGLLAYYYDSAWSYWQPFLGMVKEVASLAYQYDPDSASAWQAYTAGETTATQTISTATHTLTQADAARYSRFTYAGAKTLNVDNDAVNPITQDSEFEIRNVTSGDLTIVEYGGSVTVNPPAGGTLLVPPGGTACLKRVATDEFDLMGVTVAA